MDKPILSVVIPVYNENGVFDKVFPGIFKSLIEWNKNIEIIIIDDGSTDGLAFDVQEDFVRIIKHPINLGNGASVKSGIRAANAEYVLIMDGDGQHKVDDAIALVEKMNDYHLMVGARNFNGSSGELHRNLANKCYSYLASYMATQKIDDLTSGLRCFHREKVMELIHLFPNRFSCPTTMTLGMIKLGYSVGFQAIDVQRREGNSKIKIIQDGIRFLLIILKVATLFSPMRVFIPMALLFFSTALFNYIYVLIESQRYSVWSAVFFTTSITIFMIGLVAEEISSLKLKKEL